MPRLSNSARAQSRAAIWPNASAKAKAAQTRVAAKRIERERRAGAAMIAGTLLAFAALCSGAAWIDAQRGISVGESLASVGL